MAGASLPRMAPQVATTQILDREAEGRFKSFLALSPTGCLPASGLALKALEAPVEAGELAASGKEARLATSPGGVRFRVDFVAQRVSRLARWRPGRTESA